MLSDAEKVNRYRYEKLANDLNKEAYFQQMRDFIHKPLKHFYPCQRALVLTKAIGERPIPVTSVVLQEAGDTICQCHPGLDLPKLYNMLTSIQYQEV